jgi:hypothetical protein
MMASNDGQAGYASFGQPIAFVQKSPNTPLTPPSGQPIIELKR